MFDTRMGDCPNCGVHFPIETLRTREMTAEEKAVIEEIVIREEKKKTNKYLFKIIVDGVYRHEEFGLPRASKKEIEEVTKAAFELFPY